VPILSLLNENASTYPHTALFTGLYHRDVIIPSDITQTCDNMILEIIKTI